MALKKAEEPFDMLTALSKAEGLRCAASIVIAAYFSALEALRQSLRGGTMK